MTKNHKWRYLGPLIGLCLTLLWQAPTWAASRHDGPVVMGPDAQDLSRIKTGKGPLVMYIGSPPLRRSVHGKGARQARRSTGRHARARFADADAGR